MDGAQTLYKEYLVHYGWPEKLHSDQAGNFESKVIAEFVYNCSGPEKYVLRPITQKEMLSVKSSTKPYWVC